MNLFSRLFSAVAGAAPPTPLAAALNVSDTTQAAFKAASIRPNSL
jgi:hypothetical protein